MHTITRTLHTIGTVLKRAGDRGATMVEYVLLVALVALIGAAGWAFVGDAISDTSDNVCNEVADANTAAASPDPAGSPVSCE